MMKMKQQIIQSHNNNNSITNVMKFVAIVALLTLAPFLTSTPNFHYTPKHFIYFILNLLIIALGADAGLLSFFLQDQKLPHREDHHVKSNALEGTTTLPPPPQHQLSLFFIEETSSNSNTDTNHGPQEDGGEGEGEEEYNGDQELYQKAENFIGNFYKQLEMQREQSWNKLHLHAHK